MALRSTLRSAQKRAACKFINVCINFIFLLYVLHYENQNLMSFNLH